MAARRKGWVACGLLLAAGCTGVDGDKEPQEPLLYAAASNSYRIEYLAPPWLVKSDDGETLELEIPAEVFGLALESSPPTHVLKIGQVDDAGEIASLVGSQDGDLESGGVELPGTTSGGIVEEAEEGGVPDYFVNVDLSSHRDVAFAELNHLIDDEAALLHAELQSFTTAGGQVGAVFVVVMEPGVYIRSFYFSTESEAIRAAFISPFDLETEDIDLMAGTILTNDPETRE